MQSVTASSAQIARFRTRGAELVGMHSMERVCLSGLRAVVVQVVRFAGIRSTTVRRPTSKVEM